MDGWMDDWIVELRMVDMAANCNTRKRGGNGKKERREGRSKQAR